MIKLTYEQLWNFRSRYNRAGVLVWAPRTNRVFDSVEDRAWRMAGFAA